MIHFILRNSHNKRMLYLLAALIVLVTGCFGDDPLDMDFRSRNDNLQGSDRDIGTDPADGGAPSHFDIDLPTALPVELYAKDYVGFSNGNDAYGPTGTPPTVDANHPGYLHARCFDCHASDKAYPPEGHDPRMQYWAWSCSRGFPGGSCHGHGVNGTIPFNHARDPAFSNCTKAGCHEQFNAERKDFENHGMHEVPTDEFCHACHDYTWTGWPESDVY